MIEWWGPVIYEFYGSTESSAVTFATSEDALKRSPAPSAGFRRAPNCASSVTTAACCRVGEIGEIYSRMAGHG